MKIISFEGIDASGKTSQAKILTESLRKAEFKVAYQEFPRVDSPIGSLVKKVRTGEVELSEKAFYGLVELDRQDYMQKVKELASNNTDYLIVERWSLAGIAYGKADGVNVEWVAEVQAGVVLPDIIFVMNIPIQESFNRQPTKKELIKRDSKYLETVRDNYLVCSEILSKEGVTVPVINGHRRPGVIAREIVETLFITSLVPLEMVDFMLKEFNESIFEN